MDKRHLILRHQTWSVRVVVPRKLRSIIGRKLIYRSLKTPDLAEARRRRHRVIAEVHAEINRMVLAATMSPDSVDYVVDAARVQREAFEAGQMTEQQAEAGLDSLVQRFLERQAQKRGIEPETGHPLLAEADEQALKLAHKVFRGEQVTTVASQVDLYLTEVKPRLTAGSYEAKHKRLHAFAQWIGPHSDVGALTRKRVGAYVSEVIQKSGLEARTRRKWLSHLSAWGDWLEAYGHVEVNPFAGLSRVMRESTRGGTRAEPRPYTPEEFHRLASGLPEGSPLLPMACIAGYSGMRIDELASLKLEDVSAEAFCIRKGKNENSVRLLPIHPVLVPVVEQLKATSGDGYLITGLLPGGRDNKRSHYASKAFGYWLRHNGFDDATLNFHSLRRSFAQRAETAGIAESLTKLLTGHARVSMTYGLYSPGPDFPKLVEAMKLVSYGDTTDNLVRALGGRCRITERSRRRHKRTVE